MNKIITAHEEISGETYEKEVTIKDDMYGSIVSLGFPMSFYIKDLKRKPKDGKVWIDAGGRNHNGLGYGVYVYYEELMEIIEELENE